MFPEENIPNVEKNDMKYGQQVAQFIAKDWFTGRYSSRNTWMAEMRKYARGEQDMDYYKKKLCGEKLQRYADYTGVDFKKQLKVLPKFLNILANGLDNDLFQPRVFAIDPTAMDNKKKVRDERMGMVMAKNSGVLDMLAQVNPEFQFDPNMIEDDVEEVDLNMSLFYKEPIEKAEELLINSVLHDNKYSRVKKRLRKDLVEVGLMCSKVWTHPVNGIQVNYVQPEDAINGFTTDPFFGDCKYFGEVKTMNLADVLEYSDVEITHEELRKISGTNFFKGNELALDSKIDVCFFAFQSHNEKVYKKKKYSKDGRKSFKMIDRTADGFDGHKYGESERVVDIYTVWYQGIMLIGGNNKVISYEKVQDMAEYKGKIIPPFVFIAPEMDEKGRLHSLVERTIDTVKDLQFVEIKIQQLVSELRPNAIDINLDLMIENASSPKVKMSVEEQTALFLLKGIRYSKSQTADGDPIYAKSIREEAPAPNQSLERLANEAARLLDKLRNDLGYNEFTDGSTPHPKTLVKVSEMARLSSNQATKHYVDAVIDFDIMVWECITSRLNDIFKYSVVKEKYIAMIGEDDISVLEEVKDRSIHYFGVFVETVPTQEDIMVFNEHLSMAINEGTLDLEDVSILRRVQDPRMRELLFRVRRKKYIKEKEEKDMNKIMANADANSESSQRAEAFKQETAQIQAQLKLQSMEAESFYSLRKIEAQTTSQLMIDKQDFEGRQILEQMQTEQLLLREEYRKNRDEEIKLKGLNQSATNQSKLIDQKKYGTTPEFNFIPYQT